MFNILIDVNNVFSRVLYTIPKYGSDLEPILNNEEELEIFIERCKTDIDFISFNFQGFDRLIFAQDSTSWRKSLLEAEGQYKKQRDHSKVNWENFNKGLLEVFAYFKDSFVVKVKHLEADDIVYLLTEKFVKNGEFVTIVSTDSDFYQLLSDNVVILNPNSRHKKLLTSSGFDYKNKFEKLLKVQESKKVEDPLDIFDMSSVSFASVKPDLFFDKLFERLDVEEKDPYDEIFLKILNGDDGDNVPSCWIWVSNKNKPVRVTPKYSSKVLEDVKSLKYFEISEMTKEENVEFIRQRLEFYTKEKIDLEQFSKNLYRNWKLIYLSHSTIPKEYVELFETSYIENF